MEGTLEEKKPNIIVEFILAWFYIIVYAFKGLKFLCFDMWASMFSNAGRGMDSAFQEVDMSSENAENELMYAKTKIRKSKKQKQYHYSAKTLAKYEKMKVALENDLQNAGATRSKVANVYQFTVRNVRGDGRIFKDTMSGYSKLDINSFLLNEGFEVYEIKTNSLLNFLYKDSSILGTRMSTKDLVFWLTQLSTYIKSGITLNDAVKILSIQMKKNKKVQRIFQAVSYELSLGEAFSSALDKQGNYFPPLLINMIKAAEATGTLQETLHDMSIYYTEVDETRKEMISAITYPSIITVFSIGVVTFIIVYVVPRFTTIYAQSNIEINGFTAFIIALSNFLSKYLFLVVLLLIVLMVAIYFAYKKVKAFRTSVQIMLMHIPVVKDVIIYKELNIFAKTFASLLRNNVYITESMDILSRITNNEVYKAIMYKTINNIVKGEKISEAFADHWAVPDVAYYMIVTGESTGQLADMMQKVSDYYQEMHKNIVNSLKSFIEPVMIVLLALMVASIILAIIVPMFQYYNQII